MTSKRDLHRRVDALRTSETDARHVESDHSLGRIGRAMMDLCTGGAIGETADPDVSEEIVSAMYRVRDDSEADVDLSPTTETAIDRQVALAVELGGDREGSS